MIETLRDAQRFGFFGARPVEEAAEHSRAFVDAIGTPPAGARLIDLGSGGGLPGLVLADACPHIAITLVDRREKRTDFLRRAATRLGFDHVEVVSGDAEQVTQQVEAGELAPFDIVTARGFGPPHVTLAFAVALMAPDGKVVISEPPEGDRWSDAQLHDLGVERFRAGAVSVFRRASE